MAIFGFVVFALLRDNSGVVGTGNPNEDFLTTVSESDKGAPMDLRDKGTLPPEGMDFSSAPKLHMPDGDIDLGVIPHDDFGHIDVPIRNDGREPLLIRSITTSCACTMGEMVDEQNTIAPGETVMMKVSINPFRVPGFRSEKTLTLISNDPSMPAIERSVVADVDPEYDLATDRVDFGTFNKGETVERTVRVKQLYEKFPLKDIKLSFMSQMKTGAPVLGLDFEVVPVDESGWTTAGLAEYDLIFTVGEDLATGPFNGAVFLYVELKRFKALTIYIEGNAESV